MKYFNTSEFSDFSKMDPEFIEFLDDLRESFGKPIKLNSTYRNPNHNEKVGGVSKSAHTEIPCRAADIHCGSSGDRLRLVQLALRMGCKRIGVGSNFVHIDFSTEKPENVMWTYY